MNSIEKPQGLIMPMSSADDRIRVADLAFDYRGDVTLELETGEPLTGFVSNRNMNPPIGEPFVEIWCASEPKPRRVVLSSVRSVLFSGVDAAAGKSWENWLKKVAEAEAAGTIAELYPDEEPL